MKKECYLYHTEIINDIAHVLREFIMWSEKVLLLCCVQLFLILGCTPWTLSNCPGKNTGVGRHSLLQGIFPTQGLNLGLLHCKQIVYHLGHEGSPGDQRKPTQHISFFFFLTFYFVLEYSRLTNSVMIFWGGQCRDSVMHIPVRDISLVRFKFSVFDKRSEVERWTRTKVSGDF